jgi:hypothetical protein
MCRSIVNRLATAVMAETSERTQNPISNVDVGGTGVATNGKLIAVITSKTRPTCMNRKARIKRFSIGLNKRGGRFLLGLSTGLALADVAWLAFLCLTAHQIFIEAIVAFTAIPIAVSFSAVVMQYQRDRRDEKA